MFNLGFTELFALAAIALLVIGPKQLPEMARNLARLLNEFKRVTSTVMAPLDDIKSEVHKSRKNFQNEIDKTTKSITDYKDEIFEDRTEPHDPEEDDSFFSADTVGKTVDQNINQKVDQAKADAETKNSTHKKTEEGSES